MATYSVGGPPAPESAVTSTTSAPAAAPKVKRCRCDLCHVRVNLMGTTKEEWQTSVEEHKESTPHKHMEVIMEYGFWPGDPATASVTVKVPGLFLFDKEFTGSCVCTLCNCKLTNGSQLLHHQTDRVHKERVRLKAYTNLPVLYSCQLCDQFIGDVEESLVTHLSSDKTHLMRTSVNCDTLSSVIQKLTGIITPKSPAPSPKPAPTPKIAPIVRNEDVAMATGTSTGGRTNLANTTHIPQSACEMAWLTTFRKQFPWMNPEILRHFCVRDRIQRQLTYSQSNPAIDVYNNNNNMAQWNKALNELDHTLCSVLERILWENQNFDVQVTNQYLNDLQSMLLSSHLSVMGVAEMATAIRYIMLYYHAPWNDYVSERPTTSQMNQLPNHSIYSTWTGSKTNSSLPTPVVANSSAPKVTPSMNSAPIITNGHNGYGPITNSTNSLPPPDPTQTQDTTSQEIMDLLNSLEQTANQLSHKKETPPPAPKERALTDVVDECMAILNANNTPQTKDNLSQRLAQSFHHIVHDKRPENKVDATDAYAKLAAGFKLSSDEAASISSVSSQDIAKMINLGMKKAQEPSRVHMWSESRKPEVVDLDVSAEERRKALVDYYKTLEAQTREEEPKARDHGRRREARPKKTPSPPTQERRPVSFQMKGKKDQPKIVTTLNVYSSSGSESDRSRSRSTSKSRKKRKRRSRDRDGQQKSKKRKASKSRSPVQTQSNTFYTESRAPKPVPAVVTYPPPPVPPVLSGAYVTPVVQYPTFQAAAVTAAESTRINVQLPITPGVLSRLPRGNLSTRMLIPDQAFSIQSIVTTVATLEDLVAMTEVFTSMTDVQFLDRINTSGGFAMFMALVKRARNIPQAMPEKLDELVIKQTPLTIAGWAMSNEYTVLLSQILANANTTNRVALARKVLDQVGSLLALTSGCEVLCSVIKYVHTSIVEDMKRVFKHQRLLRMLNKECSEKVVMCMIDAGGITALNLCKELFTVDADEIMTILVKSPVFATRVFNKLLDSVASAQDILFNNIGMNPNGLLKLANENKCNEFVNKFWHSLGPRKLIVYKAVEPQIEPIILYDNIVCKSLRSIYQNKGVLPESEKSMGVACPSTQLTVPNPSLVSISPTSPTAISPVDKVATVSNNNAPSRGISRDKSRDKEDEKRRKDRERDREIVREKEKSREKERRRSRDRDSIRRRSREKSRDRERRRSAETNRASSSSRICRDKDRRSKDKDKDRKSKERRGDQREKSKEKEKQREKDKEKEEEKKKEEPKKVLEPVDTGPNPADDPEDDDIQEVPYHKPIPVLVDIDD